MASKKKLTKPEQSEQQITNTKVKKSKRGRMMVIGVIVVLLLVIAALVAVIVAKNNRAFKTDESAIRVNKDGTLEEASIDGFDEETYDKDGLTSYVENEVETYTSKHGEDTVTVKEIDVVNGKADVYLRFKSVTDYEQFYDVIMYVGTIDGAREEGIKLPADIPDDGDLDVVVTGQHVGLQVPGEIKYVSSNIIKVDDQTTSMGEESDETSLIVVVYQNNK